MVLGWVSTSCRVGRIKTRIDNIDGLFNIENEESNAFSLLGWSTPCLTESLSLYTFAGERLSYKVLNYNSYPESNVFRFMIEVFI